MKNNGGLSLGAIAFIVFVVFLILKLIKVVAWSWVWIFSPLWIYAGLLATLYLVLGILYFILRRMK